MILAQSLISAGDPMNTLALLLLLVLALDTVREILAVRVARRAARFAAVIARVGGTS